MPRVAPITDKSSVPAEYHEVVNGILEVFGQIRGPFSMLLHSPEVAERMLSFVRFFRTDCIIAPKDRSLAILTAVREREGAYVWSAQVAAASRAGVREEVINLIRQQGDPSSLMPDERDIVIFIRQLVQQNRIDQTAFNALQKRHDAQWLVELIVIASYYALLCGVVNAFEVPAPPDGDKLPG